MKRIITLLIAGAMLLGMCSCSVSRPPVEREENVAVEEKEKKESSQQNDSESIFGEASEEAEKPYTVIAENVFSEGDIQPVYGDGIMYTFGYCEYNDGEQIYLVDYEGKKTAVLGEYDSEERRVSYCDVCGEYRVGSYTVDPETLQLINNYEGHGGRSIVGFDPDSGIFYDLWGDWPTEMTEWDACSVVPVVKPVEATEEQITYGLEYGCELTGEYVLTLGNKAVERGYEYALEFDSDGIAALCKEGKWGYFNSAGEQILPCEYDASAYTYTDYSIDRKVSIPYSSSFGYIAVCKDGMWGYADLEGNMVTDLEFEEARPVYMGKAWVKMDGAWSVISFGEYTDIISEEEASAIAGEYGDDVTYSPELNGKYYGTVSYGFRNVDEYGYLSDFWVLFNGKVYTSSSRNYEYNF